MTSTTTSLTTVISKSEVATEVPVVMSPLPVPQTPLPPTVVQQNGIQTAVWTKIQQHPGKNSDIPTARHGHRALAYKHFMIMFGGGNEELFGNLNVYNLINGEWTQPQMKGDIPPSRAAYGAVIDGHRILIYGGLEEYGVFTDTLYELNVQKWEWTLLKPTSRSRDDRPCPRLGHSFTLIKDRIFMFGGLIVSHAITTYLNDLHVLYVRRNKQHGVWEIPVTYGTRPCPRESHSAVAYLTKEMRKLVIYGGMFENRLGDLFTLDIDTMMWSQIKYEGRTYFPMPRSLHSATLIGDKMYVFGGWIQECPPDRIESFDDLKKSWKCDNTLSCLNLKTMTWEKIMAVAKVPKEEGPGPRAGHSAVAISNKIYMWSGRDGYNTSHVGLRTGWKQACHSDFWKLDVQKPGTPDKVKLLRAFTNKLVVQWDPVSGADGYLLQILDYEMPTAATMNAPLDEKEFVITTTFSLPPVQGVSAESRSLDNNFVFSVPRTPIPATTPHAHIPENSFQVPKANILQLQNMNHRPAWQNSMVNQIGRGPTRISLPDGVSFKLVQPRSNLVPPRPLSTFPTFRSPLTQNSIGQIIRAPQYQIRTPESVSSSTVVGTSVPQSDIAPQFNWQTLRAQNPSSRSDLQEIVKLVAAQRQPPVTPIIPPSLAPPASAGLNPPIPPPQCSTQQSDSSLIPPPPADAPTSTTNVPSSSASTVPGNQPPLLLQQMSRPTMPTSGNMSQGPTGPQKQGNLVRILNHFPSAKNQQSILTGSHGIPGVSSAPHQQLPKHGQPSIIIQTGKVQENAATPPSNPGLQSIPGSVTRHTWTSQQLQELLTGTYGRSLLPSISPIRLVAPRQGVPNYDSTKTMTRYITYRMPNGTNVLVPAEFHSAEPTIRQLRVPVPVATEKDEGKKRLAAEGMLRLAENQSQGNQTDGQADLMQQQILQAEMAPDQSVPSSLTPVVDGHDEGSQIGAGGEDNSHIMQEQQQQEGNTILYENCAVVENNSGDPGSTSA